MKTNSISVHTWRRAEDLLGAGVDGVDAPGVSEQWDAAQGADGVHQQQRAVALAQVAQARQVLVHARAGLALRARAPAASSMVVTDVIDGCQPALCSTMACVHKCFYLSHALAAGQADSVQPLACKMQGQLQAARTWQRKRTVGLCVSTAVVSSSRV